MKKTALLIVISVVLVFALVACNSDSVWKDALYENNTELGKGAKTITVVVTAEEKSVTFTVHTDADNLGDALLGVGLVDGEQGAYGLYIKEVNGMTADYDTDSSYWALKQNGEYLMSGADFTPVFDGERFELAYEKG